MTEEIIISNLSKHYSINHGTNKNIQVIDKLSLKIKKGEFVSILGPNGCGKSTLIKIIAGLDKDYTGRVSIFGKSSTQEKIGYVPQNVTKSLFPWLTAKQNIMFALGKEKDKEVIAKEKLFRVGLEKYSNFHTYELSGGMKQLIAIARASAISNTFLFDEPLNGLDQENKNLVEEACLKLRNNQNTSIMISHDISSAVLLSDKIIIMSNKPSKVKAIIPVTLPTNRTTLMKFDATFQEIAKNVSEVLTTKEA